MLGPENFEDLAVEIENGVETLYGTADRRSTRDVTVRIAARTTGVVEVIGRLGYSYEDSTGYRPQVDPKDPRLDWERDDVMT